VLAASQSVPPGLAPGSPVQIQVCARDLWVIRP
jgi:hypothetical protein